MVSFYRPMPGRPSQLPPDVHLDVVLRCREKESVRDSYLSDEEIWDAIATAINSSSDFIKKPFLDWQKSASSNNLNTWIRRFRGRANLRPRPLKCNGSTTSHRVKTPLLEQDEEAIRILALSLDDEYASDDTVDSPVCSPRSLEADLEPKAPSVSVDSSSPDLMAPEPIILDHEFCSPEEALEIAFPIRMRRLLLAWMNKVLEARNNERELAFQERSAATALGQAPLPAPQLARTPFVLRELMFFLAIIKYLKLADPSNALSAWLRCSKQKIFDETCPLTLLSRDRFLEMVACLVIPGDLLQGFCAAWREHSLILLDRAPNFADFPLALCEHLQDTMAKYWTQFPDDDDQSNLASQELSGSLSARKRAVAIESVCVCAKRRRTSPTDEVAEIKTLDSLVLSSALLEEVQLEVSGHVLARPDVLQRFLLIIIRHALGFNAYRIYRLLNTDNALSQLDLVTAQYRALCFVERSHELVHGALVRRCASCSFFSAKTGQPERIPSTKYHCDACNASICAACHAARPDAISYHRMYSQLRPGKGDNSS